MRGIDVVFFFGCASFIADTLISCVLPAQPRRMTPTLVNVTGNHLLCNRLVAAGRLRDLNCATPPVKVDCRCAESRAPTGRFEDGGETAQPFVLRVQTQPAMLKCERNTLCQKPFAERLLPF